MALLPPEYFAVSMTKLLVKSMIASILCVSSVLSAQAQEAQPTSTNESWTATTETSAANANSSRTMESHSKSDNRTVDRRRVEVLGPNGRYEPNVEIEKETIQVDATTTRTVERSYNWDVNGRKNLVQVTEEEARASVGGDAHVVRTISNSDGYGNVYVTQREVADTTKKSPNTQETKTTVYLTDGNSRLTPYWQTQELQTRSDEHTVEVKKTRLRQFSSGGNWEVDEVRESTIKENGKNRTSEERVSRSDLNGRLSEVLRTVGKETETAAGEKSNSVETYSTQVPGTAPDGHLHLTTRVTTVQENEPSGKTTEERVEQTNAGELNGGRQVVRKTRYIVQYAASGTQQTKTVQVRDVNGNWNVAAFETSRSDQAPTEQGRATPPGQP
jgi:hypothetical protein